MMSGVRASSIRMESDRKSTRLNSSHVKISYAVFCLKKQTSGAEARAASDTGELQRLGTGGCRRGDGLGRGGGAARGVDSVHGRRADAPSESSARQRA